MFCRNCGYKLKDNELNCPECGVKVGELPGLNYVSGAPVLVSSTNNSSKFPIWLIILLVIFVIGFICIIGFVLIVAIAIATDDGLYTDEEIADYVYIDDDKIPTMYNLAGVYEMCDYPETITKYNEKVVTYSYCDIFIDDESLDEYVDDLIDDYGFEEIDADSTRTVAKYSVDDDYLIIVDIDYDNYFIHYRKALLE